MLLDTPPIPLAEVTPEQVARVYIGTRGRCCCGCSGTYWPEDEDQPTNEDRAKVAEVLLKLQRAKVEPEWFGSGWSLERGRMFNVYLR